MTYYRLAEGKSGKLLFGLALFVILGLSRNSMYPFTIIPFTISQFLMYGVVGLMGICFLWLNRKNWKSILADKRMLAVLVTSAIFLVPMLVKQDFQMMNFSILLCVYIAIFFSYFISCRELARYYVSFMVFLAGYSLVACYLLAPLVERGLFSVPEINHHDWRIFHNFVFAFPRIKENYLRNFGMFREPGVYQYFLNLALYCNNFLLTWDKTWIKWTINAILAVTVISTFSTAGFVVLALLAVAVFFQEKLYKDKRIMRLIAVLGVVGILCLIVIIVKQGTLYRSLIGMVEKLFVINSSSLARYEAVFANLKVFFRNPVFGEKLAVALTVVANNTASSLLLYAAYGILGGTLNVLGWLALAWDRERSIWLNLLLFVTLMMSFNTQNMTAEVFFWLFPIMALMEKGLPLLKRKG